MSGSSCNPYDQDSKALQLQKMFEQRATDIINIHIILIFIFRWIVGSGSHAGVYPKDKKFRKSIVNALDAVPGSF